MGFLDKAKDLLAKNSDKVDSAIDKAGDLVDKRTQGKYASHVNKVQDAAKKAVADNAAQGQVPPDQHSGQEPPASPTPAAPRKQDPPTAPPTS
ncbi:antitoxin [Mycolicibacterium poriferae]|uniref:antitoxin n=1 Tax=Mycolicibacterium poriferae TaxID=39694 RepID=UPI0024BAA63F|nr:antitoxin [Mycolicibacterium poriferae]